MEGERTLDLNTPSDTQTIGTFEIIRGGRAVMCRETCDLEGYIALKGVGSYVVDLVGVDFVGYVDKGTRGRPDEDSEIHWHNPRDRDVGGNVDRRTADVWNTDQKENPFLDRLGWVTVQVTTRKHSTPLS